MSTTYETIRYGNAGQSVRSLQTILKKKGYDLTVDGQFGVKTLKAVQDYQKKNRLNPTGIVMGKTWEKLRRDTLSPTGQSVRQGSPVEQPSGASAVTAQAISDRSAIQAQPTQTAAENAPTQSATTPATGTDTGSEATHPGEYRSRYAEALDALYDQIMGRPAFSYDLSGDPLYRQYRQQYTAQGRMAMEDTSGVAAGLTGGYGSSYSQTAGQQTYGRYLQGLNDTIPQLYSLALDRYTTQGQHLQDQFAMLRELEAQEYDRYSDAYERYLELQEQQLRAAANAGDKNASAGSGGTSSGSSSGASGGKSSEKSTSAGGAMTDSRIRELASAYIVSGYGSSYDSQDMRWWMKKQGLGEAQYEKFYAALRAMGYKPKSRSTGGSGRETYSAIM